jgi:8-oxo-dGTP diphosphatase
MSLVPAPTKASWPRPLVAVDVAAFTVLESDLKILLIERGLAPRSLALPGGFVRCGDVVVDQGEDLEAAARRELCEETRLQDGLIGQVRLRQVGAFGAPDRDPRARVISVAWLAVVRPELAAFVRAGSDAADLRWVRVADVDSLDLAFDHHRIVAACLARLRRDLWEGDVARELVPRAFTVAELRAVVDAVVGATVDPANFRRRVRDLVEDGVIVEVPGRRVTARRPAQVYAFA